MEIFVTIALLCQLNSGAMANQRAQEECQSWYVNCLMDKNASPDAVLRMANCVKTRSNR
jgi:hypothetical protein